MAENISDPRCLESGRVIPSNSYVDQPYIVVLPDGSWLCSLTTVAGHEGDKGQHILVMRSDDEGQSWSLPLPLEPIGEPESSWAVPLHVPDIGGALGRIYVFYVFNGDNIREAPCSLGTTTRMDTLGHYVFRYSDDGGRTWSQQRYHVPVREFQVDRDNPSGGKIRYFWGVAKPVKVGSRVFIALHKVGDFGIGFLCDTQGCFVASDNILYESDPEKLRWETLPDDDVGLLSPEGHVSEEQSVIELSDGSLFCVWRTIAGYPAHAYSRDGGHTWSEPLPLHDGTGRIVKHPRAANFVWRCSNGRYLYWFHHHGWDNFGSRNPVWLCGGHEAEGPDGKVLVWSQPEILLYDDDLSKGISYPDLFEVDGRFFVSETQKTVARSHEIPRQLLEALWNQPNTATIARKGLAWEKVGRGAVEMPVLPRLHSERGGFTLEMRMRFDDFTPWQVLFDSRREDGRGLFLQSTDRQTLRLTLSGGVLPGIRGGVNESSWECDRGTFHLGQWHHIAVTVDGGPKIIAWVVDGVHLSGGAERTHGWGRFHPQLEEIDGASTARIAPNFHGEIVFVRFYMRPLLTSELVGNWRAQV